MSVKREVLQNWLKGHVKGKQGWIQSSLDKVLYTYDPTQISTHPHMSEGPQVVPLFLQGAQKFFNAQYFKILIQCIEVCNLRIWHPCMISSFPFYFKNRVFTQSSMSKDGLNCLLTLQTIGTPQLCVKTAWE